MKKQLILVLALLALCFTVAIGQGNKKKYINIKDKWDTPPSVLKSEPIKYPEDAKKDSIQGTIWFKVVIDVEGKVKSVDVLKKDKVTESMITEATNSVKQYIFNPAKVKGKSVESTITLPIKFKLQ